MNQSVSRTERLNAEFQKEIYDVIKRKLKNPFITEMFSITKVDVSKDLKHAKVFISVYSTNEEKKQTTYNAIVEDAKRIRYELSKSMRLRTVPEISFLQDETMAYGDKMDKLFLKINEGNND